MNSLHQVSAYALRKLWRIQHLLGVAEGEFPARARRFLRLQRYAFSVQGEVTLGTPSSVFMENGPSVGMRPDKLVLNTPCAGFLELHSVQVKNRSVIIGASADGHLFSSDSLPRIPLKVDRMKVGDKARVAGFYNGYCPEPFTKGMKYVVVGTFHGWQSIDLRNMLLGRD